MLKTFPHARQEAGDTPSLGEPLGVCKEDWIPQLTQDPDLSPWCLHLSPPLFSHLGQPQCVLPLRTTDEDQGKDPRSPAPRVCCPFKGMANTGYWRVGEAGLGNQPEGAIWSKLLWDPCHGVFTGPTRLLRGSLADSPSKVRNTALCGPSSPHHTHSRTVAQGPWGVLKGRFLCPGRPLQPGPGENVELSGKG